MSYKSTIPALFTAVFIMTTQDPNLSAQDNADLKDGVYAEIETNHESYHGKGEIAHSRTIASLLRIRLPD